MRSGEGMGFVFLLSLSLSLLYRIAYDTGSYKIPTRRTHTHTHTSIHPSFFDSRKKKKTS